MNTENRVFMGARLREEREALGLLQADMAALGAAKPRTYQDWERGIAVVSAEFLAAVATHGVDVGYVITGRRTTQAKSAGSGVNAGDVASAMEAVMVSSGVAIALALDVVKTAHVATFADRLKKLSPAVGAADPGTQRLLEMVSEGVAGYLQNVVDAPVSRAAGSNVQIGGDVGQSVSGDQHNAGPVSFNVGKRGK